MKEFLTKILNKEQRKTAVELILTPFSWIYGAGVWLRNAAFNMGILKQESFDVPVVSVGNITVGGTGKRKGGLGALGGMMGKFKMPF